MTRSATTPEEHLRRGDPILGAIIDAVVRERRGTGLAWPPDPAMPPEPNIPTDHYSMLIRAIVSQNISIVASTAIYRRLNERFGGRPPTPQEILDNDPDELRVTAGLSRAKTASLRSLAEHILSGELDLEQLHELADDDVLTQLVAVKGIGPWTAQIFMMFHLHRPDVLPVGDLEIRRCVQYEYRLAEPPKPPELERIAEPWRPYRTLACMYLWQVAHAKPRLPGASTTEAAGAQDSTR
jgi:DNA-3-methyladenine glycosylase II